MLSLINITIKIGLRDTLISKGRILFTVMKILYGISSEQ